MASWIHTLIGVSETPSASSKRVKKFLSESDYVIYYRDGYIDPHDYSREFTTMPSRQCVKVDAHAASSDAAGNSHSRGNRATGGQNKSQKYREKSASKKQTVLPTTELSPERALDSRIKYSARKYQVGAGTVVEDLPAETTSGVSCERSLSDFVMHVPKLNSEMGTETDDEWQPSDLIPLGTFFERFYSPSEMANSVSLPTASHCTDFPPKHEVGEIKQSLWSLSPPTWNAKKRQWKLEQDDFVEIPKELVEYEKMQENLQRQKKFIRQQRRLEKGKDMAQGMNGRSDNPAVIANRSNAPDDQKTRNSNASQKASNRARVSGTHQLPPIHNTAPVLTPSAETDASTPVQKPLDSNVYDNAQPRRKTKYQKSHVPTNHRKVCTCALLPVYFSQDPDAIPSLATWSGSKVEFLCHVHQMSSCFGHSLFTRDACRRICKEHNYPSQLGDQAIISFSKVPRSIAATTNHPSDSQLSTTPKSDEMWALQAGNVPTQPRMNGSQSRPQTSLLKHPGQLSYPNTIPILKKASAASIPQSSSEANESSTLMLPSSPTPNKRSQEASPESDAPLHISTRKADPMASRGQGVTATSQNQLPQMSFNLRSRHQSMPAFAVRSGDGDWPTAQRRLHNAIERPSTNTATFGNDTLVATVVRLSNEVEQIRLDHSNQVGPIATAPTPAAAGPAAQARQASIRKKTAAERKATGQPELSRDVDPSLRLSDRKLLRIGRKSTNGYERHKKAPYAFSYRGRLFSEYKYLLTKCDRHGHQVWDYDIISRVRP